MRDCCSDCVRLVVERAEGCLRLHTLGLLLILDFDFDLLAVPLELCL